MNWNSLIKIRRLFQSRFAQLSIVNVGLLALLVTTSVIYYFNLLTYSSNFFHQQMTKISMANKNLAQTSDGVLFQEKNVLKEKINVCQEEKKNLANYLETEKEIHRKINATLNEKLCEQKKNSTANATTFDKKLFNYMATFLRDTPYPGVENYTRYTVARLGMKPLTGIEPLKPEFGPVINDVTSFRYPITIPACQTNVSANQSVFIAVISAPGNFDKRNTIRQTWREHLKLEYHKSLMTIAGFSFIMGMSDQNETQIKIKEENKNNGDIIQINMDDFYRNLSLKVAGLFNWLYRNCPKVDFILKVDDDVYVNVRNLAHFIESYRNESDRSIYGNSAGNLFPARGGTKWDMTNEAWPWKDYPRYFFGPGVIFPGRTILSFLASFQTTPLMDIDDVYYSGICSEKAGVNVRWSTSSTGVFEMGQAEVPPACDLRRFISWLTVSHNHMNNSHVVTEDFYRNRTRCTVVASNGTNTTIDYTVPIQFDFN